MKKQHLLTRMLLLVALLVGSTNVWGEDTYTQITSVEDLDTEATYIIADVTGSNVQAFGSLSSSRGTIITSGLSVSSTTIKVSDNAANKPLEFTLTKSGDYYLISYGSTPTYLTYSSGTTFGTATTAPTANSGKWNIAYNETYKCLLINNANTGNRYILRNGTSAYGPYSNQNLSSYGKATLYKKDETSPLKSIAISGDYPTVFLQNAAFSHEGMTVTATYENSTNKDVTDDAVFSGYNMATAGNQTVTVSYTENEVTKTTTYDITVNELQAFTVSFSDGGSITEASAGAGVTLPTRENVASYTFMGWSESNIASATTTAPTILTGTYNPSGNITLYPVYSFSAGSYANEWREITAVPEDGTYAICSASYFMKAEISSNRFANGAATPSISDGKLTVAPTEDCIWEISKVSDYWVIKHGDQYAAAKSSNNQGQLTDSPSDNYEKWTIEYDSEEFKIGNKGKSSKYLRNNSNNGWAPYNSDTGDAPRLFKKTSGVVLATYYVSTPAVASVAINSACTDGANYYGTYSNSSAFVVPADLTISEITVNDGKLSLTNYATGEIVPANTGVMMASETAGDHDVVITTGGTSKLGSDNMLKASGDAGITAEAMAAAAPSGSKFYRLTMHNGTSLGFYWGAADGAAFDIAANKAYLAVPASLAKDGFGFGDDETTGINLNVKDNITNSPMYNLSGQRVGEGYKGLVIVNGKKFINK